MVATLQQLKCGMVKKGRSGGIQELQNYPVNGKEEFIVSNVPNTEKWFRGNFKTGRKETQALMDIGTQLSSLPSYLL